MMHHDLILGGRTGNIARVKCGLLQVTDLIISASRDVGGHALTTPWTSSRSWKTSFRLKPNGPLNVREPLTNKPCLSCTPYEETFDAGKGLPNSFKVHSHSDYVL